MLRRSTTYLSRLCLWAAVLLARTPTANAQNVNDGFDPNADSAVFAAAVQSDGKLIIGGAFSHIGGISQNCLARLNADGSLDAAFNPIISSGLCDILAIALLPNGQILIGGIFDEVNSIPLENIARLNPDGSLDTTFEPMANAQVIMIAAQSDGKILLGGQFGQINGQNLRGLARVNSDGSLDASFVSPVFTGFNKVRAMLVQSDGRIVLGGDLFPGSATHSVGALRLLPDGTIDNGFLPALSNGSSDPEVTALGLQADGKIVLGGLFTGVGNGAYQVSNLARVNPDGSGDASFDTLANPVIDSNVRALAIQANGDILIGGPFTQVQGVVRNRVARVSGINGVVSNFDANAGGPVYALAVQADNKILIGGSFATVASAARNNIARVTTAGDLDDTLNLVANSFVAAVAALPDGTLLIGGAFTQIGATTRNHLARILSQGKVGPSYDPNANGDVFAIAVEPDNSTLVGGNFTQIGNHAHTYIAHLGAGGNADASFAPVLDDAVSGISQQPNGQILLYGAFTHINGVPRSGFARLNADGSLDNAFIADPDHLVYQVASLANGQILVAGTFDKIGTQTVGNLARLNSDGSVDTTFAASSIGYIDTFAAEPGGNILVGGTFTTIDGQVCSSLARLNSDGTFNQCFAVSTDGGIDSLVELSNQKILIQGLFQHVGGQAYAGVVRLRANGSLDNTFADIGLNSEVYAYTIAPDGKIVLGGAFTMAGAQARSGLVRISLPEAVEQSLSVNVNQTAVTWSRSGPGEILESPPELAYSSDGSTYSTLGAMTHVSGGWRFSGLQPPMAQNYYLRVQATQYAAFGSQGVTQDTSVFFLGDDIFQNGFEP